MPDRVPTAKEWWTALETLRQIRDGCRDPRDEARRALNLLDAHAPSPRSEAGGGPCCVDRARRGWCDCARAPVPAESATKEAAAPVVSTVVWTESGADGTCSGRCARCNTRWNAYPSEQNGISDAHWRTGCGAAATKGEEDGR